MQVLDLHNRGRVRVVSTSVGGVVARNSLTSVVFERLRTTHTRSTAQADEVLPQG
eukprot:COSAG01_NODE_52069_length_349_cov_1.040000_1_plen_54_part_10